MNAGLFGSNGAALMSVFHQLFGGRRGSGEGRSPPRTWAQIRNVTSATAGIRLFSFTISCCPNNRHVRRLPVEGGRAGERAIRWASRKGSVDARSRSGVCPAPPVRPESVARDHLPCGRHNSGCHIRRRRPRGGGELLHADRWSHSASRLVEL